MVNFESEYDVGDVIEYYQDTRLGPNAKTYFAKILEVKFDNQKTYFKPSDYPTTLSLSSHGNEYWPEQKQIIRKFTESK